MDKQSPNDEMEADILSVTLPGTVEKIIPPVAGEPEKAQISIEGADPLYREVRVENTVEDDKGKEASLKLGAEVEVTVKAPANATKPKDSGH